MIDGYCVAVCVLVSLICCSMLYCHVVVLHRLCTKDVDTALTSRSMQLVDNTQSPHCTALLTHSPRATTASPRRLPTSIQAQS